MENPDFLNPAREKSDALPLLLHAFDNVQRLRPTQFSPDSNDETRRQTVMPNEFLHFTEKIKRIICSARAVYETTQDVSSLRDVKHAFFMRNRISNEK